MKKTTIQIEKETLERLKTHKRYDRESYDEVLNTLLNDAEEEVLSNEEISEIQKGLEDIKTGRTFSLSEIAKEFNVSLK